MNPKETGKERTPLIFDSPHSGRAYPDDFDYDCKRDLLCHAEDNHIDQLFDNVPAHGSALLCAEFPRTYIDVNRCHTDIDPDILSAKWPGEIKSSERSYAGIGLIRRLLKPGIPVYNKALPPAAIQSRIENYYHPYHKALSILIDEMHYSFGQVWHINCHSFPSSKGRARQSRKMPANFRHQPDFVIGDRDGTSCDLAFTRALRDFLKDLGYRVAINNPYKGVEIVRTHGIPSQGRHSIQLEINKALYWNEEKHEPSKYYDEFKKDIDTFILFCTEFINTQLSQKMAAD